MAGAKKTRSTRSSRSAARSKKLEVTAASFKALAGDSKRARLMVEVEEFRSVPTSFTSFNRATTVGGAPLSCVWLVHGPSGGGKTAFLVGLIKDFQRSGGLTAFVDAELAADTKRWFVQLGLDPRRCVYIGRTSEDEKVEPLTYEEVVVEVDGLLKRYQAGKKDGSIPPKTPLLVVVDSVSKMVPKSLLKNLEGKKGADALRSGVGRLQALMNTAWLAELGTKVGDDDILLAIVAHEMESSDAWGYDYKVRGGGALIYDSMMQVRVVFAGQVKDKAEDGAVAVGKRHRVQVIKNKHGPPFGSAHFYTATGEGVSPVGFDRVREIVHEGLLRGVISGPKDPKKLTVGSKLEWKGRKMTLKQLYDPKLAEVVETIARELDAELVEELPGVE